MSNATSPVTDQPIPPRYWWLKRIVVLILLIVALMAAMWGYWCWRVEKQLNHELALIHQRGEPWEWREFQEAPVPASDNAATHYLRAISKLSASSEEIDFLLEVPNFPIPPERVESVRRIIAKNHDAWRDVRDAVTLRGVNWGIENLPGRYGHSTPMPWVQMRSLAFIGRTHSYLEHESGSDADVLEDINATLHLAAAARHYSTVLGWLFSTAIDTIAAQTLQEIAPDLRIGDEKNQARSQQVRALIANLLDEQGRRDICVRMVCDYRRYMFDEFKKPSYAGVMGELPPITKYLKAEVLQSWSPMIKAAQQHQWPDVVAATARPVPDWNAHSLVQEALLDSRENARSPANTRMLFLDYRAVLDRRMAAIALALRLYAVEHDGHWPDSLDSLVPTYLPEIPRDPFSGHEEPIKWVRDDKQPRLYSVGEDGKDDSGSMETKNLETFRRWNAIDIVFFLQRPTTRIDPPRPSPTTQPDVLPGHGWQ